MDGVGLNGSTMNAPPLGAASNARIRLRLNTSMPAALREALDPLGVQPTSIVRGILGDLAAHEPNALAWFQARYGVPFNPQPRPRLPRDRFRWSDDRVPRALAAAMDAGEL